ncbi:MAG: carboxypeptidase-like regulatory domain-containing protein, partial [Solirubrobacteraceae bacterium]|nr:carboxypeptidase-like regulatory domain-containing protein [Solirubrobacteraceae bacterium]
SLTARTGEPLHPSALEAGLVVAGPFAPPLITQGCTVEDCTFGDEQDPLDPGDLLTSSTAGVLPGLALLARCEGSLPSACKNGDPQDTGPLALARLWRSAVDLEDAAAPSLGPATGSLLGAGGVTGRASLAADVADAGGGVAEVRLLVDDAPAQTLRPGGPCAEPYDTAAPCPAALPVRFEVDTAALAPGPHTARLVARDAAGQETTGPAVPFTVLAAGPPPGPPPGPGPAPAPATPASATITVDRRRLAPGASAEVTGRVRRADGTPAADAVLEVVARRFGEGAAEVIERSARTDADGRFAVRAGLVARRLVVRLADPDYRPATSPEVRIAGRLKVTLERRKGKLRNGSQMTLDARIAGAGPGAATGRVILVQAIVRGRWQTVESLKAGPLGRATWRYRFTGTTRPAVYRFRAVAPGGGEAWPWETTTSAVERVPVRP